MRACLQCFADSEARDSGSAPQLSSSTVTTRACIPTGSLRDSSSASVSRTRAWLNASLPARLGGSASVVLPIPGSPTRRSMRPLPPEARRSASRRCSSSWDLPTKRSAGIVPMATSGLRASSAPRRPYAIGARSVGRRPAPRAPGPEPHPGPGDRRRRATRRGGHRCPWPSRDLPARVPTQEQTSSRSMNGGSRNEPRIHGTLDSHAAAAEPKRFSRLLQRGSSIAASG